MTTQDGHCLENRLCLVCGDVANGVHYNVLSCEGCKSFFLRSIKSETVFKCTQGGDCSMDLYMRRHCPACRLAKCQNLGMTKSKVWDKSRLGTRKPLVRKVGKKKKDKEKEKEKSLDAIKPTDAQMELIEKLEKAFEMSKTICREYLTKAPVQGMKMQVLKLESSQSQNVEKSVEAPEEKPSTSSEIVICDELRKYAMDTFAIVVRQTIGFARGIPGFLRLSHDDQAVLVRSGVIDSMILRLAEFFVVEENKIVNDLGDSYDVKMMSSLGLPTFSESSFKFLKQMKMLDLTTAEYGLMNAASLIAPDREELTDTLLVEEIQLEIIMALQAITRVNHPGQPTLFAELVIKLANMREISMIHQQDIMKMKLLQQDFTPLVAELFNVE